tara:strand:+ start:31492 stop:31635 length:144 start_codon:yes stop_codon:yes gene_type:complete
MTYEFCFTLFFSIIANTGGGGGGSVHNYGSNIGGNGGSGIVVIRYVG